MNDAGNPEKYIGLGIIPIQTYEDLVAKYLVPQHDEVPRPEVLFEVNGCAVLTKKSTSVIKAKAKVGKTTVAGWIAAQLLRGGKKVLWIDTEQGGYYGSVTQHRILKTIGRDRCTILQYWNLRTVSIAGRLAMIEQIISQSGIKFDLIVIDGVRDLVFDFNNTFEVARLSEKIHELVETYGTHILNIIHENKNDGNARGHLGAELINKAETVIALYQDKNRNIVVKSDDSRGLPFDSFILSRDEDGICHLSDEPRSTTLQPKTNWSTPTEIALPILFKFLSEVFATSPELTSGQLISQFKAVSASSGSGMGQDAAKRLRNYCIEKKYIEAKQGQTGNSTVNKLGIEYENKSS